MKPLFDALKQLNVNVTFLEKENHLPVVIRGGNNKNLDVTLDAEMSSQFTSALLMSGAKYESGLNIHLIGNEIAKSYVDITLNMIKQFGGMAYRSDENIYKVLPINSYLAQEYYIEPDVSSACYFFAMAALIGGSVLVEEVHLNSIQGDIKFLNVLRRLGCIIKDTDKGIKVTGPKNAEYEGIDVDMNDFSDQTMTMAVLAIFASSPTRIRNIQHIKHQETNRISATINELTKLGIKVDETDDGIIIYPSAPKTGSIETYEDHRMAMSFSLVGLRGEGIVIKNPDCVSKTFETYFSELDKVIKAHT